MLLRDMDIVSEMYVIKSRGRQDISVRDRKRKDMFFYFFVEAEATWLDL